MKRLFLLLLCVCLLAGCAGKAPHAQQTVYAMDTVMDLQTWGADCETATSQLQDLIAGLEADWSVTIEDSLINRLNGGGVVLTQEQHELLEQVSAMKELTCRLYDPQLYSLCSAWGFYGQQFRVPSDNEIAQAQALKRWDLGGALKGYCGNKAVALLDTLNIEYAILNLGGNIQTYREKPDGSPWQIGIQNPAGGDPVGVVSVTGTMAVVTSGDYQRSFEADGKTYHHILDPRTGYPADSGLRSVTVISEEGLTADCLSTALFVMGLEEGTQFWRENRDFEAVFLTADGKLYATEGVKLTGCAFEVIT